MSTLRTPADVDFRTATDRLLELGFTLDDIADVFGVARNSVNRWRMAPGNPHSRTVPPAWRETLARLGETRREALGDFLGELAKEG